MKYILKIKIKLNKILRKNKKPKQIKKLIFRYVQQKKKLYDVVWDFFNWGMTLISQ